MHVIFHATNDFSDTSKPAHRASKIVVVLRAPVRLKEWTAILRREHDVVVQ